MRAEPIKNSASRQDGFHPCHRLTYGFDIRQDAGISLTSMGMLSTEDLQAIGTVVDEKIKAGNEKQTEAILDVLSAVKEGFDGVDKRFEETGRETDLKLSKLKHELMDHTDRVVQKAVGDLRAELREANVLAS